MVLSRSLSRSVSRSLAAAGAAVLVSTALVGCGSSDDTLTAKEFRTQANKLCADASKDTDKMGADLTEKSSDADVTKAVDDAVARNNQLVNDIADLKPPKDLQDDVDSLLDSVRDALKKLDTVGSVQDLQAMEDPFTEVNQKSEELGLDTCAK